MKTIINLESLILIAKEAAFGIMKVYNNEKLFANTELKSDSSPLTLADKTAHEIIYNGLIKLHPEIPIISEEGEQIDFEIRKNWATFWLVDPLDGTKEFIKRNGEFTVNIALIENNMPVFGIIYVPVSDIIYFTENNKTYKREKGITNKIEVSHKKNNLTAVESRSHSSENEKNLLAKYDIQNTISVGSSLKFCMLAEAKADIYYRDGPTMEWDTAAGQAILTQAGGIVEGLSYNKPVLRNGNFLCKNKVLIINY